QLGVTYKCAWRIGHQLRILMAERAKAQNPGPLSGHVELDETYIGGKRGGRGRGPGKGAYLRNKAVVFGLVQRDGVLRSHVVPNELASTLMPIIQANVAPGTKVSTDQAAHYKP